MPALYNPVRLMCMLNTEIAPLTVTVPFNKVRLMVVKIRYIRMRNLLLLRWPRINCDLCDINNKDLWLLWFD